MLTDNPLMINGKLDELITRFREEQINNMVMEQEMTSNVMRVLLKRQQQLVPDNATFMAKVNEQLQMLKIVEDPYQDLQMLLDKMTTLQKEKDDFLRD